MLGVTLDRAHPQQFLAAHQPPSSNTYSGVRLSSASPRNLSMPWPHSTCRTSSTDKRHCGTYGLRTRVSSPSPAPAVKPLGDRAFCVAAPTLRNSLPLRQRWILLNLPSRDTCSHRLLAASLFVPLSVHLCSYKASLGLLKGATEN